MRNDYVEGVLMGAFFMTAVFLIVGLAAIVLFANYGVTDTAGILTVNVTEHLHKIRELTNEVIALFN